MAETPDRIDPAEICALPLAERRSYIDIERVAIHPDAPPPDAPAPLAEQIDRLAEAFRAARRRGAARIVIYGAHLIKNGCALLVNRLIERGWVTHLATQGAGIIHDWEFAYQGRSSESVRDNAPAGRFGTWQETGAAMIDAAHDGAGGAGLGAALGKRINAQALHYRQFSVTACAAAHGVPLCVMPGVGYDIFVCHPSFTADAGAALGRAATLDFHTFAAAVRNLPGGALLSVGTAVMGPQVFEKAFSIANNLRASAGEPFITGHHLAVVDIQPGGGWDWSTEGEPPMDHPAYYLRWCKSYARLAEVGGVFDYLQADNRLVLHRLVAALGAGA